MPSSLIERRKTQTRQEIAGVALGLFQRDGYARVSVEKIAQASGVSLRTFYRYFSSKEDVLAPILEEGTGDFAAAVARRPADEDLATAARRAYAQIAPSSDGQLLVRALIRLLAEVPALRARWLAALRTLEDQLVPAVNQRVDRQLSELEAQLTAAAIVTALRVSLELWAAGDSAEYLADVFGRALDQIDRGAERQAPGQDQQLTEGLHQARSSRGGLPRIL
jgi:AcrR family transcriptional regulator